MSTIWTPTHWDYRMMEVATLVSSWSKDPSTKVGAVIADDRHSIQGTGYNGLPRGVKDSSERLTNRDIKYAIALHAEDNAILNAQSAGHKVQGCTLYVTMPPCSHCAARISQVDIARVVCIAPNTDFLERWASSLDLARTVLQETGVDFQYLPVAAV